jgi:hypothetical protein
MCRRSAYQAETSKIGRPLALTGLFAQLDTEFWSRQARNVLRRAGVAWAATLRGSVLFDIRVNQQRLRGRWATWWPAELRGSGGRIACTVEDISRHGAKLRIGAAQIADENVWLVVGEFGPIAGRVRWRCRDHAGVQFNASQPWGLDLVMMTAAQGQSVAATKRAVT